MPGTRRADPAAALIKQRLHQQQLTRSTLRTAQDVVSWLGAVQSQDYTGAKWGVGQRAIALTDADVDREFNDGAILRTHMMRPTWHFVAPADIRWMQALTGPRVHAANRYYNHKFGLDTKLLTRARTVIERALRDHTYLTRAELGAALSRARIDAKDGLPLAYIVVYAELEAAICSGPRRGKQLASQRQAAAHPSTGAIRDGAKQFTYALVDERVPRKIERRLTRDEALAELTRRYFTSHGPATIRDFVWWSGLTVRDTKAGLDAIAPVVQKETIGDLTYWCVPASGTAPAPAAPNAWLLPNYDEYAIAYKDRGAFGGSAGAAAAGSAAAGNLPKEFDVYAHLLAIDGRLGGSWRRSVTRGPVTVTVTPSRPLTRVNTRSLAAAIDRYRTFLGVPVTLSMA